MLILVNINAGCFHLPPPKKNRYNGVMEEFFGHLEQLPNETDRSNGKLPDDDESIHSLAALGVRQTISEINWTDEKDKDQSQASFQYAFNH